MPVLRSVMLNLRKQYGAKKGNSVYYALENSGKLDKARQTAARKAANGSKTEYLRK